jgi:hypothetical protein
MTFDIYCSSIWWHQDIELPLGDFLHDTFCIGVYVYSVGLEVLMQTLAYDKEVTAEVKA